MSPWTSVIWTFKQFDFCLLFFKCPHLKNFKSMFALLLFFFFFGISLEFTTTDVRLNTPRINVNVNISCYALYIPLHNSQALTAGQPLNQTHHTGRDVITSHHFLSLSCSRLPQDVSIESNTIPLPNVSFHPFYLHGKWITNQQPPRRHTRRVRPSISFPLSPHPSRFIFYLVSFESTVSKTTRVNTRWFDSFRLESSTLLIIPLSFFTVFLLRVAQNRLSLTLAV